MKSVYKIVCALALVGGLVSCGKAEFHTVDFVSFSNSRFTVKDDGSVLKVPVILLSDKSIQTTVTYTITPINAVAGEDYTLETNTGVLTVSSDAKEKSDSIVIRTINKVGELQGNKKFSIVLNAVTADGIQLGATSTCTITIIDVDGGINLLMGDWLGSGLATSKNAADISWTLAEVSESDPGLEDFPEANIKIAAASKLKDPIGNEWSYQVDVYAFYNEDNSTLNIYPDQVFDAGNFGGDVGVLYIGMCNDTDTDVVLNVEEGILTFTTDVWMQLYNEDGSMSNYSCGKILSGGQIVKQ